MNQVEPGLIVLLIFIPMTFSLLMVSYLAHAYIARLELLLSNSRFVKYHKETFSGLGFMGKVVRSGFIVFVLLMPQLMARRGGVDVDQVKNFPIKLKRILVGSWSVLFLSAMALMLFVPKG
ncbi:hypothetical protein [Pseudomonas sp. NPDC086251]|jgi:hypothetical protein|uniref:hypothetical protein n=1 Tax=Pseudomonas sp. NPDC086251 TaxID=3364431 RepID=UPI003834FC82